MNARNGSRERFERLAVFALAVASAAATSAWCFGADRISQLGAYFDGHLYIEIAKSFPLPYAPEAVGYLGHAPGFPAQLYLARSLTLFWIDWGTLATVSTWLAAAAAAWVFYGLCRDLGLPARAATACFVLANPVWLLLAATPHSEPLATTFALLCLRAHLRGSVPASMLWLSLATLTRFPAILLGGALAVDLLLVRGQRDWKSFAWLCVPLFALALHNLYLYARIPGFEGIWTARDTHWQLQWTWPFAGFLRYAAPPASPAALLQRVLTYASLALYLVAIVLGLRRGGSERWLLPSWIALLVGFHVSLSGKPGVDDFMRLVVLAWPAAVLVLWRGLDSCRAQAIGLFASAFAGAVGVWYATIHIPLAARMQDSLPWMAPALERLDRDEPVWIDFDAAWRRGGR